MRKKLKLTPLDKAILSKIWALTKNADKVLFFARRFSNLNKEKDGDIYGRKQQRKKRIVYSVKGLSEIQTSTIRK